MSTMYAYHKVIAYSTIVYIPGSLFERYRGIVYPTALVILTIGLVVYAMQFSSDFEHASVPEL